MYIFSIVVAKIWTLDNISKKIKILCGTCGVHLYPPYHIFASSFFLTSSTRDLLGSYAFPKRVHVPKLEPIVTNYIVNVPYCVFYHIYGNFLMVLIKNSTNLEPFILIKFYHMMEIFGWGSSTSPLLDRDVALRWISLYLVLSSWVHTFDRLSFGVNIL